METAIKVIKKIKEKGFDAYIVGGAVRDYLLNKKPNDIDIATNATPDIISKIFKSYPTGLKFGSVTISYAKNKYEVTTFRKDFDYLDSRRPDKISFSNSIQEDSVRRDFTINALYLNENMKVLDFNNGLTDLKNKLIRAVGIPTDRFKEDALRIFRAFYFQSKLGFQIEKNTLNAINENAKNIKNIAVERIYQEFIKMIKQPFLFEAINSIINSEIIKFIPFKKFFSFLIKEKPILNELQFFILAYLFDNKVKDFFKFSNKYLYEFELFKNLVDNKTNITRYLIYKEGFERVKFYLKICRFLNIKINDDSKQILNERINITNRKDVKITNQEIIKILNKKPGPWIKDIEAKIINNILEFNLLNKKEAIIKFIKEHCDE